MPQLVLVLRPLLAASSCDGKVKGFLGLFYKDANPIPSRPNHPPKVPPPDTFGLGVRI